MEQPSTTELFLVRWGTPSPQQVVLVAGSQILADALAAELPGGMLTPGEPEGADMAVALRDGMARLGEPWLRLARLVVAIDPSDADRLLALRSMAGHQDGRLVVLPSLDTIATAEHTLLLMLALARHLLPAYSEVVAGTRRPGVSSHLTGPDAGAPNWAGIPEPLTLWGRTLGILGIGRTGQAVAQRGRALGMPVIYHDLQPKPPAEARLGVARRRFDQLLREADILSLHLPLTPETTRLIDAPELALMKPSALLINTAHGRLIDEGSLIKALRTRSIAGAGLDVFAYEALPQTSPLLALDNVVLTPHLAGTHPEANARDAAQRAAAYLLNCD